MLGSPVKPVLPSFWTAFSVVVVAGTYLYLVVNQFKENLVEMILYHAKLL